MSPPSGPRARRRRTTSSSSLVRRGHRPALREDEVRLGAHDPAPQHQRLGLEPAGLTRHVPVTVELVEPGVEAVEQALVRRTGEQRAAHPARLAGRDRGQHVARVAEVPEERAGRDPRRRGDLVDRDIEAVCAQELSPARSIRIDVWIRRRSQTSARCCGSSGGTGSLSHPGSARARLHTVGGLCQDAANNLHTTGGYVRCERQTTRVGSAARGGRCTDRWRSESPSPRW